jgi:ribosome-binding protein aMBF1 (putative translation factor)
MKSRRLSGSPLGPHDLPVLSVEEVRRQARAALANYAAQFRSCREQMGWSVAEAAARTGLSATRISAIEMNKPHITLRDWIRLADSYGLDLSIRPPVAAEWK